MQRYTWLLFDADGTLFDYDKAEMQALRQTFEQFGHAYQTEYLALYRPINQKLWVELEQGTITQAALQVRRFELLLQSLGIQGDGSAFGTCYLQNLAGAWALMDGAEEMIRALHPAYRLMIVTNGLKDVQRPRLNASPIGKYFDDVVISEEVGAAKPSRAFFDVAFARMGNPPKREVLLIGDSLSADIRGGIDYGIDTCWFNPAHLPRPAGWDIRYEISVLGQFIILLEELGARDEA
jgi:YjjG family noncanonical pyrimidine nucleotidase